MAFKSDQATISKTYPKIIGIDPKSAKLLPYVNLDNEGKEKLKLRVFDEEPKYIMERTNDNGDKYNVMTIELYYRVENSTMNDMVGRIFPLRFYIDDIERPEGRNSGKMQFLNEEGRSAWLFDENDEENMKWWKDKETGNINKNGLKRALNGEVDFMESLNQMLSLRNAFEPFNWKKVAMGDTSELQQAIKQANDWWINKLTTQGKNPSTDFPKFSVLYYVTQKEKDDKTYFIQNQWTGKFTAKDIRKELKRKEDSGYPLKGFYKFENTVTNYLTEFDQSKMVESSPDELPF